MPNADYVRDNFYKERWAVGDVAWFEYHCYEGHDSSDAEIWYRSQQQVTVIEGPTYDDTPVDDKEVFTEPWGGAEERAEDGVPWYYRVRFADGLEWGVFEDELLTSREGFQRPAPPPRPAQNDRPEADNG